MAKFQVLSRNFSVKAAKNHDNSQQRNVLTAKIETRISHKRSRRAHTTMEFGVISMRLIQSQDYKFPIFCICVSSTSIAINLKIFVYYSM
jgi:hypothetical protein